MAPHKFQLAMSASIGQCVYVYGRRLIASILLFSAISHCDRISLCTGRRPAEKMASSSRHRLLVAPEQARRHTCMQIADTQTEGNQISRRTGRQDRQTDRHADRRVGMLAFMLAYLSVLL